MPSGGDALEATAKQEAQRLDDAFPLERLQRFVANGGWDPDVTDLRP
jgi:hypothetical protein